MKAWRVVLMCILILVLLVAGLFVWLKFGTLPDFKIDVPDDTSSNVIVADSPDNPSASVSTADADGYFHLACDQILNGIEISNVKLKLLDKRKTEITADVKNVSGNFSEAKNVELKVMIDDDVKIIGGIIPLLDIDEKKEFVTFALSDLTSSSEIIFEEIAFNDESI